MNVQIGDIVHVKCRVVSVAPCGIRVGVSSQETMSITPAQIVHVKPRPLAVGDKVKNTEFAASPAGEVLAIVGDWVMVLFQHYPVCVQLTNLVRA